MSRLLLIALLLWSGQITAFAPERVIYSFEGVAFNTHGKLVANSGLDLHIWIRNQKESGAIVYEENQTVYTNDKGIFFVLIGNGKTINGSMSMMASEAASHFMKIEMSSIGETNGYGPIKFKCIKCKRCNDRYIPHRVEAHL